jgi:sulfur transfer protein SufE
MPERKEPLYQSMQRVSECESVVFFWAAASPQGWPPPKTSLFI